MASNKERRELIWGDGTLAKATLTYPDPINKNKKKSIQVQFNPAEYSIARGVDSEETNGKGQNATPEQQQQKQENLATMTVQLILDTTSYVEEDDTIEKNYPDYLQDEKELSGICRDMALITKMTSDSHKSNLLCFSWGTMEFYGIVISLSIQYQMFNRNGQPVRVSIDMTIKGEEKELLNEIGANPRQSPDRTKYRRLNPREELWMLADLEYDDVSCWKEIARENGILNPRKVDYTRRLKIPAL